MKDKLKPYLDKFDQQPIRIRLLLTFVAVMLLILIFDQLWIAGNYEKAKYLESELVVVEETIDDLIKQQQALNASIVNQRNHPVHNQLKQVREQIDQARFQLEEKTIHLIKPELMSSVLKEIIANSKKLKLLRISKQPPVALFDPNDQNQLIAMYRHTVELDLQGEYQETLSFIKQLEQMEQKVNFESLLYQVESHPVSRIQLVVSTLSLNKKWIGG